MTTVEYHETFLTVPPHYGQGAYPPPAPLDPSTHLYPPLPDVEWQFSIANETGWWGESGDGFTIEPGPNASSSALAWPVDDAWSSTGFRTVVRFSAPFRGTVSLLRMFGRDESSSVPTMSISLRNADTGQILSSWSAPNGLSIPWDTFTAGFPAAGSYELVILVTRPDYSYEVNARIADLKIQAAPRKPKVRAGGRIIQWPA